MQLPVGAGISKRLTLKAKGIVTHRGHDYQFALIMKWNLQRETTNMAFNFVKRCFVVI